MVHHSFQKRTLCALVMISLSLLLAACVSDKDKDSYSSTYHSDSNYKSNVDKIASEWGTSSEEVDSKITAIVDALND